MHDPERHFKTLVGIAESVSRSLLDDGWGDSTVSEECVVLAAALGEMMLCQRYGVSVYSSQSDRLVEDFNLEGDHRVPTSPESSLVLGMTKNERHCEDQSADQFRRAVNEMRQLLGV
jgi:hypothetical protein